MTLVCECGGLVELEDGTDRTDGFEETYRCLMCGRRGRYVVDERTGTDRTTGCLTSSFG